jgi:type II secretory ATPase GspE/PulE/Tfp pilus assembly ATPase PilB-like protein
MDFACRSTRFNASTDLIREAACRAGMTTLAEDGRRLVEEGVTTIEEVLSVTTVHEMAPSVPSTAPIVAR